MVSTPLSLGFRTFVLESDTSEDVITIPLLFGGTTDVKFVNVSTYPWQRQRIVNAIRLAGFEVDPSRRRLSPMWWRVD
jgi:hypothetical protein